MAKELCTMSAAVRLVMKFPFWCELYYSMKVIEDESIPTLCTDGISMWVNPTFYNALKYEYRVSALAHESCHKMLHHCTRGRGLDPYWSNIAMDIVVNTLLQENGFPIHPDWVQPEAKYKGWSFEAVYKDILKDLPKPPPPRGGGQGDPKDGNGQPQPGGGMPDDIPQKYKGAWADVKPYQGNAAAREAREQKIDQEVAKAVANAKAMGNAPVGVEAAFEMSRFVAAEKWYDHLHRFMQSLRSGEYNWARMNKRVMVAFGYCAPDLYSEAMGPVDLYRDTSGSCYSRAAQANFNSHVMAILQEAKPSHVNVMDFDTEVHALREIEPYELEFQAPPKGGGGTSFRNLFPYAAERGTNPEVAIILTDLMGSMPDASDEPPYPVIWAVVGDYECPVPFGEVIRVK